MGAEAAVNAVYFNKIQEKPEAERADYVAALQEEYREDVDLLKLASELHLDEIVAPEDLRANLIARVGRAQRRALSPAKRKSVTPV